MGEPTLGLPLHGGDPGPELAVDLQGLCPGLLVALDPLGVEVLDLLQDHLRNIRGPDLLAGGRIDHLCAEHLVDLGDHLLEDGDGLCVHLLLVLSHVFLELLLLIVRQVHPAAELLGADDDPLRSGGNFQRVVLHVLARPPEDRVQQLLLRRELGLALGADLADEDVARPDTGANTDHAVGIEVPEHLFRDVWNVAGELFATELRLSDLHIEVLDVNRREHVVLDEMLGNDDRVLEVVPVKGTEPDQHVLADAQLAVERRGSIGDDLPIVDVLAEADDGLLVLAGALVEAHELAKLVLIGVIDDDAVGVHVGDGAAAPGLDDHAREVADDLFHARGNHRWLDLDQGNRLALHVGPHQRPVGIIVLEEGDQGR